MLSYKNLLWGTYILIYKWTRQLLSKIRAAWGRISDVITSLSLMQGMPLYEPGDVFLCNGYEPVNTTV